MTVTPLNVMDIHNVYTLISEIGVKKFSITYTYPYKKGKLFFEEDYVEFMKIYEYEIMKIKEKNKKDNINLRYFIPIEIQSRNASKSSVNKNLEKVFNYDILHWTIDANGNIYNFMDYD